MVNRDTPQLIDLYDIVGTFGESADCLIEIEISSVVVVVVVPLQKPPRWMLREVACSSAYCRLF